MPRSFLIVVALAAILSGCADKQVTLKYEPDSSLTPIAGAGRLAVFQFADRRGSEGDQDPYRVGGVYGGYGNRLSKVMTTTPWQRTLARAIAAGLKARGVDVITVDDREFSPTAVAAAPLMLAGEIRNFSTESRWSTGAHIAAIVRLHDAQGAVLVEKMISNRESWGMGMGVLMGDEPLESTLNATLAGFVRKLISDPEITVKLGVTQ